jgi:glutamyl-tRNA reductase
MDILVVGLNYRTSPVELREKLAFNIAEAQELYEKLLDYRKIREAVLLSTCNRVEVYSWANEEGKDHIISTLEESKGIPSQTIILSLYIYRGKEAVKHIFRVASSLDSMVLGEPQIVGQVKEAFEEALTCDATGVILNQLMKKALSVSKRVRTETAIGESAISVSYAAVELAKKIFGDLANRKAMLVGAGEMAELAARHLVHQGVSRITVVNRTLSRAQELAQELQGQALPMDRLEEKLAEVDIVITSTGAPHTIITSDAVQKTMKERKRRPIFFIDIAVPRDVDPEVEKVENVYLYDIDDLEQVVEENRKRRKKESLKAEAIVDEEVERFLQWLKSQEVIPVIVSLRNRCEEIRRKELEKAMSQMHLNGKETEALEALTTAIVNKILHTPLSYVKDAASQGEGEKVAKLVKELFALEEKDDHTDRHQGQ